MLLKSFIKINPNEIPASDLRAILQTQTDLLALTAKVEAARVNKNDTTDMHKFLIEVKKYIS